MPEDPPVETSTRSHSWAWWAVWAFLILFVAYPLSLGPVIWLGEHNMLPSGAEQTIEIIYAPIGVLYHSSSVAESAIDWYLDLWGVK